MTKSQNIFSLSIKYILFFFTFLAYFSFINISNSQNKLEGSYTDLKILDKISSKNTLLKLKNGDLLLTDAACEFNKYASDITRTIPIKKADKKAPQPSIKNSFFGSVGNFISIFSVHYFKTYKKLLCSLMGSCMTLCFPSSARLFMDADIFRMPSWASTVRPWDKNIP